MSSLWKKRSIINETHQQYIQRPSSKCGSDSLSGLAQDHFKTIAQQIPHIHINPLSIERISLLTFLRSKVSASMTVEATIVLPLFLLFFLNLSCAMEMIRLHGNLELALWHTGNKMSAYGTIAENVLEMMEESAGEREEEVGSELLGEVGDVVFSSQYVKWQILQYLGEDYLNASPLLDGVNGLNFWESEIFTEDDYLEIILTYGVVPWIKWDDIGSFRMMNRYYGHVWNGYEIPGAAEGMITETVYIAENGEVYHTSSSCTHLSLTIRVIGYERIPFERNAGGSRYTPCELCVEGTAPGNVYVGAEGDRYHFKRGCSGLKRTFYSVLITEAGDYPACSRCEGRNHN